MKLVMSGKDGKEMIEGKTKRSAETQETDDAKRKKVDQPVGKFSVSSCTSLCSMLDSFYM